MLIPRLSKSRNCYARAGCLTKLGCCFGGRKIKLSFEIILASVEGLWKKISQELSFRLLAYVLLAAFLCATILSVIVSGYLFSVTDRKNEQSTQANSAKIDKQKLTLNESDLKAVVDRNIFNRDGTHGDLQEIADEATVVTSGEIVKSSLPLKLWGIIFTGDPNNGIAIIEDTNKKTTNSFMVDDQLNSSTVVNKILRERVILQRSGRMEFVALEKKELVRSRRGSKASQSSPTAGSGFNAEVTRAKGRLEKFKEEGFEFAENKIKMTSAYKQKLITTDMSKVLQDAKAEPNMVDGQLQGFRLTKIRSPSIFEKSGLANGDIVTEINGVELSSAAQAIRTMQSLRTANQIEVTVIQNGVKRVIEINVGQ